MKLFSFFSFLLICALCQGQVGIGTTNPSQNAVLDVTSANKGLMLPRLADTTLVANPTAGLMIYDIESSAPNYHDGVRWNRVESSRQSPVPDSFTYTITNPARMAGFVAGTFPAESVSTGHSQGGGPFGLIQFSKGMDVNTIFFNKAMATNADLQSMVIEFKAYIPGQSNPYFSIKVTGGELLAFSEAIPTSSLVSEAYTLLPDIIGFRNHVANNQFSWNNLNSTVSTSY